MYHKHHTHIICVHIVHTRVHRTHMCAHHTHMYQDQGSQIIDIGIIHTYSQNRLVDLSALQIYASYMYTCIHPHQGHVLHKNVNHTYMHQGQGAQIIDICIVYASCVHAQCKHANKHHPFLHQYHAYIHHMYMYHMNKYMHHVFMHHTYTHHAYMCHGYKNYEYVHHGYMHHVKGRR